MPGKSNSLPIRGNTLRVYLHLLRHGPCELRDVQHALNLSTASLASYHLGKLIEGGYVKQDEQSGKYHVLKDVSGEALEGYTRIGVSVVPQFFFLALLFSILISFFSYESMLSPLYTPYLVLAALANVALIWYETVRLWRKLVSWK